MAPLALRHGGFVAIDMFQQMLPRLAGTILQLALWLVALIVLVVAAQIGWDHFNSGWLFKSSSMKVPAGLISERPVRMPLAYSYLSLLLSVSLMISLSGADGLEMARYQAKSDIKPRELADDDIVALVAVLPPSRKRRPA